MSRYLLPFFMFVLFSLSGNAQTVGLFQNDSLAFNGYTLFAPNSSLNTYLIDNCGKKINSWTSTNTPGLSAYLLEDGDLLRTVRVPSMFGGGGTGGRIERYSWDGQLEWSYLHSTPDYHQHHDIEPLPNGNILILAWEFHSQAECIAAGRDPSEVGSGGVWLEQIVEIEPTGANGANIVWEWHLWDHLIQDFDETKPNYGIVADHPELMDFNFVPNSGPGQNPDWIHANSVSYNAELDQIMLSSRTMSEIWIIDHSTTTEEAAGHAGGNSGKGGDIIYRWGNPEVYDHGTSADKKLYSQHHATWIPQGYPNEGKILVFNNGVNRPGGNRSSADIINPPVDLSGNYTYVDDQAYGPVNLFWTYGTDLDEFFYSSNISGALAMPNGNILICDGTKGNFIEVDLDGTVRWEYVSPITSNGAVTQGTTPNGNNVFRALKYSADFPGFVGKDLTPGEPLEVDPLQYDCMIYDGVVTSAPILEVLHDVKILGNLIAETLYIENETGQFLSFEIYDLSGRKIIDHNLREGISETNVNYLNSGMYFVRIFDESRSRFVIEKIIVNKE
ncbi:MAG: aryl-sulfate sulfotransferase [Bacteroidota bacterium]